MLPFDAGAGGLPVTMAWLLYAAGVTATGLAALIGEAVEFAGAEARSARRLHAA
jgi:hypothetical protein